MWAGAPRRARAARLGDDDTGVEVWGPYAIDGVSPTRTYPRQGDDKKRNRRDGGPLPEPLCRHGIGCSSPGAHLPCHFPRSDPDT